MAVGRRLRWLIAGAVVVLAVVCSSWTMRALAGPTGRPQVVERGEMKMVVEADGELESARSVLIAAPTVPCAWRFNITFMAPEGSEVEPGDQVLAFDAKAFEQDAIVKRAELAAARKEFDKAGLDEQGELDRLLLEKARYEMEEAKSERKADVPEHLVSEIESKKSRLDWELARDSRAFAERRVEAQTTSIVARLGELDSRVERLNGELGELEACIEAMSVTAPRAGLVVYRRDWNDKKFKVGKNVFQGWVVIELPDLNQMQVAAEVAEPDAGKVTVGQIAEIRLDSQPDRLFAGQVLSLGKVFRTKSDDKPSVVFDAVVAIDEPDPELMRPGMVASVDLVVDQVHDIVFVPEEAIVYAATGPQIIVRRPFGGTVTVPVILGRSSAGKVAVLDGLDDGDVMIVPEGARGR